MDKIKFILIIFFSALLVSCGTQKCIIKEVPIETIKTQTEYIEKIKYDSIHIYDSVDRYTKNDTVFIYKEKTKFQYKYMRDTIIIKDSIQYPQYITNEIEVNKLKTWQVVLMCLGVGFICFCLLKILKLFKLCWLKL